MNETILVNCWIRRFYCGGIFTHPRRRKTTTTNTVTTFYCKMYNYQFANNKFTRFRDDVRSWFCTFACGISYGVGCVCVPFFIINIFLLLFSRNWNWNLITNLNWYNTFSFIMTRKTQFSRLWNIAFFLSLERESN